MDLNSECSYGEEYFFWTVIGQEVQVNNVLVQDIQVGRSYTVYKREVVFFSFFFLIV